MKPKEQLMYLLEHYYIGDYSTDIFVDEFYRIYNFDIDDCDLSKKQADLFLELSGIIDRYSSFEEDLETPNLYFSEEKVRQKSTEIYLKLIENKK